MTQSTPPGFIPFPSLSHLAQSLTLKPLWLTSEAYFGSELFHHMLSISLYLYQLLSRSVVGATSEEDANDEESIASGAPQVPKDECYQIVGTMHDSTKTKPEWVDEIVEVIISLAYNKRGGLISKILWY